MTHTLTDLGWTPALQAAAEECVDGGSGDCTPLRLTSVHKGRAVGEGNRGTQGLHHAPSLRLAVGDWVLADAAGRITALLPRATLLQRRAAGTGVAVQLIAANVDVMFIVSACNDDFNPARLERYLVLAHAAQITPVIVLTRADLADPAPYIARARALSDGLDVVALNAKTEAHLLGTWCKGTSVLLGSSGVGKSTLANGLTEADLATGDIREDDAKGRHTTTSRQMFALRGGGWLIDTPGVRELQLSDVAGGIDATFADIAALAMGCHFRDCTHLAEPKCAVQDAISGGALDGARLERWRKLVAEEAANSAASARATTRAAGKYTAKSAAKRR